MQMLPSLYSLIISYYSIVSIEQNKSNFWASESVVLAVQIQSNGTSKGEGIIESHIYRRLQSYIEAASTLVASLIVRDARGWKARY